MSSKPGQAEGAPESSLDEQIANLTPEQAEMFTRLFAQAIKKRRLIVFGQLSALVTMLITLLVALVVWVNREPGAFVGWVFLIPFALAGGTLIVFGRLAKRAEKPPPGDSGV